MNLGIYIGLAAAEQGIWGSYLHLANPSFSRTSQLFIVSTLSPFADLPLFWFFLIIFFYCHCSKMSSRSFLETHDVEVFFSFHPPYLDRRQWFNNLRRLYRRDYEMLSQQFTNSWWIFMLSPPKSQKLMMRQEKTLQLDREERKETPLPEHFP